jgi:hypothetical protein
VQKGNADNVTRLHRAAGYDQVDFFAVAILSLVGGGAVCSFWSTISLREGEGETREAEKSERLHFGNLMKTKREKRVEMIK